MARYCTSCGTELDQQDRFCQACGARVAPVAGPPTGRAPGPPGLAARGTAGPPYLTTREVVALCPDVVNASTVQYLARSGLLPGRKEGNRWRFERPDAERFCRQWRVRRGAAGEPAGTGRPARRALRRVLASDAVAVLNVAASLVGLGAVAVGVVPLLAGLLLAALGVLGAGLARAWSRAHRPSKADVVDGEPVDPAAVEWSRHAGAWSIAAAAPVATLFAATGYLAFAVSPLAEDGGDGQPAAEPPQVEQRNPNDAGPAGPAAAETDFAAGDLLVVNTDDAKFRAGPGTEFEVRSELDFGHELEYLGESLVDDDGFHWLLCRTTGGTEGWIAAEVVEYAG